jgi:ornithine cyclodeaminase/alanine dehydrogenase-like protein (mu-crystallin family)
MRILNGDDVRSAVPVSAAVKAVADAFAQIASGRAEVPLRISLGQAEHDSHTFFMPALLGGGKGSQSAIGMKVVSVFPHNAARHQLPTIHALVALFDPATGQALAVLDGRLLTALRTGAASGAATQALAREDSSTLAIFGAGGQAPYQVLAVCAVRPITRILIVNRGRERAERLRERLAMEGVQADILIAESAQAALAEADVVCCATSATFPIFSGNDIRPGTHINGVGSFTPNMAEVPVTAIARARVFVDQQVAAWSEAGDLIAAHTAGALNKSQTTEIGAVIAGIAPGRRSPEEITFFKSVGNAVQDLAVGQLALQEATRLGLGVEVVW